MNDIPTYWGVAATLIWIATRDIEACRIAFKEDTFFAVAFALAQHELKMQSELKNEPAPFANLPGHIVSGGPSIDDLESQLIAMIQKEQLKAKGKKRDSEFFEEIPDIEWDQLKLGIFNGSTGNPIVGYCDVSSVDHPTWRCIRFNGSAVQGAVKAPGAEAAEVQPAATPAKDARELQEKLAEEFDGGSSDAQVAKPTGEKQLTVMENREQCAREFMATLTTRDDTKNPCHAWKSKTIAHVASQCKCTIDAVKKSTGGFIDGEMNAVKNLLR